jgi:hypothetical protein
MVVEWELDDQRCTCTGQALERHLASPALEDQRAGVPGTRSNSQVTCA